MSFRGVTTAQRPRKNMIKACLTTVILLAALAGCGRREKPAAFDFVSPSTAQLQVSALPESAMRVRWSQPIIPTQVDAGTLVTVMITLTNTGDRTWPDVGMADPKQKGGAYAVRLSYWFLASGSGAPPSRLGPRTDLTQPLAPGESAKLTVVIRAPDQPGDYTLSFELLQESVVWFADLGADTLTVPVRVVSPAAAASPTRTP
jgi:Ig-like domain from next to BRCA1 gene